MTTRLIVLGTGGNCEDIIDVVAALRAADGSDRYDVVGFLDDDEATWGETVRGAEVLGPLSGATEYDDDICFVNGIGSPNNHATKGEIIASTGVPTTRFETLVHPSAVVSETAELGAGVVLFPHVTVGSGAVIGDHVVVLPNSVVSHHAVVGDYGCVAGGACLSGGVDIGEACYLGSNCSIREDVRVGRESLVGMGSVVIDDVPADAVVTGTPAGPLGE